MKPAMLRLLRLTTIVLGGFLATPAAILAADIDADGISSTTRGAARFQERDGASLYRAICQGCHMADGRGARGAGTYPALAGNARVGVAPYLLVTILRGRNGMPAVGAMLDDEQVAAVARYVRTNLGNTYAEPVSAADVKAL